MPFTHKEFFDVSICWTVLFCCKGQDSFFFLWKRARLRFTNFTSERGLSTKLSFPGSLSARCVSCSLSIFLLNELVLRSRNAFSLTKSFSFLC